METQVSVIVPVYNMEKYLPQCLDSIIHQTLNDIEIIAVNDGSTDTSPAILYEYSNKYKNIIILNQSNSGAGLARNNGIRHARGKYLIFIDPDDWYPHDNCLKELYTAAEKNHILICGGIIIRNNNGIRTVLDENNIKNYFCNRIVKSGDYTDIYGHQRFLFRTDLIKKNNIYFPSYKRFQDPPFTVKALACAGKFYGLKKEVYEYRVGYKKINYTLHTSIDILCGIRDVFQLVKEYNLNGIYENKMINICEENIVPFYKYSFCGNLQIDKAIEEINEIKKEITQNKEYKKLTEEHVCKMRNESKEEYETLQKVLGNDKLKIIYGAGLYACNLIEQFYNKMQKVIGIAVSENIKDPDRKLLGLPVKCIEKYVPYKNDLLIVIVTMSSYQEEIEKKLKQLGFRNILKPDMKKIELAESLIEI